MDSQLEERRKAIAALCREYGVLRLDVFGSAAQGAFDPATSDLDFAMTLADCGAIGLAMRYLRGRSGIEALLARPVGMIFDDSIRNPSFREEIEETRRSVFLAPEEAAAA